MNDGWSISVEEDVTLSQSQMFLFYYQWMGSLKFSKQHPLWQKKREQKIKQDQVTTKLDIEHIQFLVYINNYAYDWGKPVLVHSCQETDCPSHGSNTSHTSGCVDGSRIDSEKNWAVRPT